MRFKADNRDTCNYLADGKSKSLACGAPGVARNAKDVRCKDHGGHLDYTERFIDGRWVPWTNLK